MNGPEKNDDPLRGVLREWHVDAELPPRFRENVWRRIERAEELKSAVNSRWSRVMNWIDTMLPRPALASSYVAILLVAGAMIGWTHARQESVRINDHLSAQYVRSVDPYYPIQ